MENKQQSTAMPPVPYAEMFVCDIFIIADLFPFLKSMYLHFAVVRFIHCVDTRVVLHKMFDFTYKAYMISRLNPLDVE